MQVPPPSADGRRRGRGGRGPGVVDGELRAAQLQVDVEGVDGDVADRRPPRRSAPPGAASGTAAGCRPRQLVSPTALFLFFCLSVNLSCGLPWFRQRIAPITHLSTISWIPPRTFSLPTYRGRRSKRKHPVARFGSNSERNLQYLHVKTNVTWLYLLNCESARRPESTSLALRELHRGFLRAILNGWLRVRSTRSSLDGAGFQW